MSEKKQTRNGRWEKKRAKIVGCVSTTPPSYSITSPSSSVGSYVFSSSLRLNLADFVTGISGVDPSPLHWASVSIGIE